MAEKSRIVCKDTWGFWQDRGLSLYCSIEGVDRCFADRHMDMIENRHHVPRPQHVRFRHAKNHRKNVGFATSVSLVLGLFFRRY